MNKYVPFLLVISIIVNLSFSLYWRLTLNRQYSNIVEKKLIDANERLVDMTTAALDYTKYVIASNYLDHLSTLSASTNNFEKSTEEQIFYENRETISYHYYQAYKNPIARIGSVDFMAGDISPYGGVITQIYPDSIIINNKFRLPNSNYRSVTTITTPQIPLINTQEIKQNARIDNRMRE